MGEALKGGWCRNHLDARVIDQRTSLAMPSHLLPDCRCR